MKKTVEVTITKVIEIEIPDESLTPEAIAEYEDNMSELPYGVTSLFTLVARLVAQDGDNVYVEGVGRCRASYDPREDFTDIVVDVIDEYFDYNLEAE